MYVESIHVRQFRNLEPQALQFTQGVNVLVGDNAQGKTNLLESVCLCGWGKSPRSDKEKEMIRWNEDWAYVRADFCSLPGKGSVEMKLSRKEKKRVLINEVPVQKIGELLGYLNVVFFSPDEMKIIKQSPQERRRFLDIDLCQLDKNYFYALSRYNRAILQRNHLLKKHHDIKTLQDVLSVWDGQIANEGVKIVRKRKKFLQTLSPLAQEAHAKITSGKELFALEYQTELAGDTAEELEQSFLALLKTDLEKQMRLGFTPCGPHRDDVKFSADGTDLRAYGSQGQQRTAALTLKFAEVEWFRFVTGDSPVLLLDDVLSELDEKRQEQLLRLPGGEQTIITTTRIDGIPPSCINRIYSVHNGKASLK